MNPLTGPKPIETAYKGYRFRSRLEARWAVFFDALGVTYQYEPEGFELGAAGRYLPDFWLPEQESWVEIKGTYPDLVERQKMLTFAKQIETEAFCFDRGDFQVPRYINQAGPLGGLEGAWVSRLNPVVFDDEPDQGFWWAECIACCTETIVDAGPTKIDGVRRFNYQPGFVGIVGTKHWEKHIVNAHGEPRDKDTKLKFGCDDTQRLVKAYLAARGARFEHGEHGR